MSSGISPNTESQRPTPTPCALRYKQEFDFDRLGNMYCEAASKATVGQENPLPLVLIGDGDEAVHRFDRHG